MTQPKNGLPEAETKSALQRLLVVLIATIAILIYSYAWTSTDIDLATPQEPSRQEHLTRALRELLAPQIFEQEREVVTFEVPFLMDCEAGDAPQAVDTNSDGMVVTIEPACAAAGETVTVYVTNAPVGADGRIQWIPPAGASGEANPRPRDILELERQDFVIGSDGTFTGTIEVPLIRGGEGEVHQVRMLTGVPSGRIQFSNTANQVMARMAETIFMALVATTIAIPIAVLISFFAAKNLMREVTLSTGTMLVTFIALVIGYWVSSKLMARAAEFVAPLLTGNALSWIVMLVLLVLFLAGAFTLYRRLNVEQENKRGLEPQPTVQVVNTVLISLVIVVVVAALYGLMALIGQQIMGFAETLRPEAVSDMGSWLNNAMVDLIWSVGNLLNLFGTLIGLFINVIAGVAGSFAFASIVGTLFTSPLRQIRGMTSNVLAGVMGAISGGLVMAGAAAFGMWAAWLGVLPLFIGAILGGTVFKQLVNRVFPRQQRIGLPTGMERFTQQLIYYVGAAAVFAFLFWYLSFQRTMIDGTLPSGTPHGIFNMTDYMFRAILVGAVLGGIGGAIAGLQAVFPLGDLLYNVSRIVLNMVRSVEPLIMGLVFVIWVGIGPFAGVLALTLHSIASLGKLYSEQIENIDPGPIEALQSTGANRLQTILYAVVPQIVPPYIAFTMYRWDINVRMSTIIGFVGGGGIGFLLQQQINLLRYRDAGVAVLAIAIVVSILDYTSAYIRENWT
jgi:phosphonate ABC transporter permease subunit PhnE